MKTVNHRFVSRRGHAVTVYQIHAMQPHPSGVMMARGRVVRTWAVVCGVDVDVAPGCSYMAPSAVHAAGY